MAMRAIQRSGNGASVGVVFVLPLSLQLLDYRRTIALDAVQVVAKLVLPLTVIADGLESVKGEPDIRSKLSASLTQLFHGLPFT